MTSQLDSFPVLPVADAEDFSHFVQFYDSDEFLVESVAGYAAAGLGVGDAVVLIATPQHRRGIEELLRCGAIDVQRAQAEGSLVTLDGRETLCKITVDGEPDRDRFLEHIGALIGKLAQGGRRVCAFGEMVALLCSDGNGQAAAKLEDLWNQLAKTHCFSLYCAYPLHTFDGRGKADLFQTICGHHSHILPTDRGGAIGRFNGSQHAAAFLRQRSRTLTVERDKQVKAENARMLLAAIVDSSDDAIISKSLNGVITSWNVGATRLFGYSAEEAVGRHISMLFPPDRLAEEDRILEKLRRGERVEHFETVRVTKAGAPVDLSLTISPIRNPAGEIVGASKVARDISERKRVENALRESRQELACELAALTRLHAISSMLVQESDPNALYNGILDAAVEIMHSDFASIQTVDEQQNALRMLAWRGFGPEFGKIFELNGPGTPTSCAVARATSERVIVPDVETCSFIAGTAALESHRKNAIRAVQSTPLFSRGGKLVGMISTHWRTCHHPSERDLRLFDLLARQAADLMDRTQAQQKLRDGEERFRALVNLLPVGMYTCGPSGQITYFNDQAVALWGRSPSLVDPTERYCGSFRLLQTDGSVISSDQCPMAEAIRDGKVFRNQEVIIERPDGSRITVLVNIDPLRDADGTSIGAINVFHDVSALKHAELQLKEADRRKDEFLATLAHELRNPLAPIRNSLHILRLAGQNSPATERIHDMMERQVAHLVRLVDDLLELSRISRGKIELKKERVELAALLLHARETSRPLIDAGGHSVAMQIPSAPIYLQGDFVRLAQVFANLLNNAAKYTNKGGAISVSAEDHGDSVTVFVRDNGIGIPGAMLSRVFDMFTQVDNPLKRSQDGLGIGLSLVKSLVAMHGGSVEAASEGLGHGSEFRVTLPTLPAPTSLAPASKTVPDAKATGDSARFRILVVDDNKDSADSLSTLLQFIGADVQTVYGGHAALGLLDGYRPSVILMDLGMPDIDGCEVARIIRRNPEYQHIILIALTGWGQEDDRRRSQEAGFNHHLVKPVDIAALQSLLDSCAHNTP